MTTTIRMLDGKPRPWCTSHCLYLPAGEEWCVICRAEKWERSEKKATEKVARVSDGGAKKW